MPVDSSLFWLLAVPPVLIVGVSKGGFGGGLGVVAVPLISLLMPPAQAAAIILPILCFMDLLGIWVYRGRWDGSTLAVLLPAAAVGVGLGAATFRWLDEAMVRLLIGVLASTFALRYWWRLWCRGAVAPRRPDWQRGSLWGVVAGFTSFVAHAGGPPLNLYLLPLRLEKGRYQATTVAFFAVVNYVKLLPYAGLGLLDAPNLKISAALLPVAVAGVGLGVWLHKRVADRAFYHAAYAMLLATGAKLVWDGLR